MAATPVSEDFNKNDLLAMNGQRFSSNTGKVILQSFYNSSETLSGSSNIYFVQINLSQSDTSAPKIYLSGLFNRNIGDSILITKGRFDFQISTNYINF